MALTRFRDQTHADKSGEDIQSNLTFMWEQIRRPVYQLQYLGSVSMRKASGSL
jgi:hypothetical protein